MKGKKKAEKPADEKGSKEDLIRTYITSDGKEFQVPFDSLKKHSVLIKNLDPEPATFNRIDSQTFECILKYVEIRKQCPDPKPITSPLPATDITKLVDKADAQLINQITSKGWGFFQRVLDASRYFGIDYLRDILLARVATEFISKDKDTLQSEYGIKELDPQQEEKLKEQLKAILKATKK